jgi:VanZ family protein
MTMPIAPIAPTPFVRASRTLFWCLAAVVFTLTHWPKLQVPEIVPRTDLWIHLTTFATWTIVCGVAAFFGPRWSRLNITTTTLIAIAYAAFDESTQFFSPGRTVALDDFGANCTGVLVGSLLMMGCWWLKGRPSPAA